jgi:hypothetical protein
VYDAEQAAGPSITVLVGRYVNWHSSAIAPGADQVHVGDVSPPSVGVLVIVGALVAKALDAATVTATNAAPVTSSARTPNRTSAHGRRAGRAVVLVTAVDAVLGVGGACPAISADAKDFDAPATNLDG